MKVLLGSRVGKLGQGVVDLLNLQVINAQIDRFPDGESNVLINREDVVAGAKVLVMHSLCNDGDIVEFLLIADALNRLGVRDIVLVAPYFCYARADRIVTPGSAIGAKVIAKLIGERVSSLMVVDVHFSQFEGFFDVPVHNVLPWELLSDSMAGTPEFTLVAPDMGAVKKLKSLSGKLGVDLVIMNKYRPKVCLSEITEVVGEIRGRDCVIVDDIVCSGGSLCNSAAKLKEFGARSIRAFVTHGIFSGTARQRIMDSKIDEVIVTDSVLGNQTEGKVRVMSAVNLIAKEISSVYPDVNTKGPHC